MRAYLTFKPPIDGVMNEEEDNLLNKESYKIYHDHPWMKMKLQILKAAHG